MMTLNKYWFFRRSRWIAASIFLIYPMLNHAAPARNSVTNLSIVGTVINLPRCVINEGNNVKVDFGDDVYIKLIDGVTYKKRPIDYTMSCLDLDHTNLKVTIRGQREAGFGRGLIGTSVSGLGIQLYHDNKAIASGEGINFRFGSQPKLYAVPVVNDPDEIQARAFNAMASMVIDYQ